MTKANQFHAAGNTFRRTSAVKIPMKERKYNKKKWKMKQDIEDDIKYKRRQKWWKKKKGEKK